MIGWPPYRVSIAEQAQPGENTVEIELAGTLRNLLGPHHLAGGDPDRTNPEHFRDKAGWTNDYILTPFGWDQIRLGWKRVGKPGARLQGLAVSKHAIKEGKANLRSPKSRRLPSSGSRPPNSEDIACKHRFGAADERREQGVPGQSRTSTTCAGCQACLASNDRSCRPPAWLTASNGRTRSFRGFACAILSHRTMVRLSSGIDDAWGVVLPLRAKMGAPS